MKKVTISGFAAVLMVFLVVPTLGAQEVTGSLSGEVVITDSTDPFVAIAEVYDASRCVHRSRGSRSTSPSQLHPRRHQRPNARRE